MSEKAQARRQSLSLGLIIASVLLVTALVGIGLLALYKSASKPAVQDDQASSEYRGTVVDPPKDLPDFTLTSNKGEPIHLSDLRGRKVLMFFGYTHCPDFCPLTLNDYKTVRDKLGDGAKNVAFVFISVDGKRDTPQAVDQYLKVRDVDDFMIGMTGTEDMVSQIGADYGLSVETTPDPNAPDGYDVVHTTASYLLDTQGRLRVIFSGEDGPYFSLNTDAIIQRIEEIN